MNGTDARQELGDDAQILFLFGDGYNAYPLEARTSLDRTDPGYLTFWAREGKKPHDATMRGIELLGKEVIPALREHQSALVTGKEVTPWPQ